MRLTSTTFKTNVESKIEANLKSNLFKQNFVTLNSSIWEKFNFEVELCIHCRAQCRCAHFWLHASNKDFSHYHIFNFDPKLK
jgi:hypothetical protein